MRFPIVARRAAAVAAIMYPLVPAHAQARPADSSAASPAVGRLRALVAAVVARDHARLTTHIDQSHAPAALRVFTAAGRADRLAGWQVGRAPLALRGVRENGPNRAAAALANPVTEEIDSLFVEVEAEAPHRIVRTGLRPGAGGPLATATRRRPTTDSARAAELRRYVRRLGTEGQFSGVVLLAREGRPLLHVAHGLANRDTDTPNRLDTKFNLGSANKNFTAVVIAQLVEEGRLSWEDPLSKFIPDFPDSASARKVQIRHLLTHTSGLGSYFNKQYIESSRARWRTVDDMMQLARPDSLAFEPGTRWAYSNTGYLLLGKVIEVVTGKDYFEVVRERIYRKVGMPNTDAYELDRVNRNLAVGYVPEPGPDGVEWRNNVFEHVIRGGPAGGGYATAPDMLKYAEALRTGKLVKPATLQLMRTPKPELGSPQYGYGFALFDGPQYWGHGGDFPGIDFDLEQYGESGYTLVVLANTHNVNDPIKRKVRRMLTEAGVVAAR